MTNMADLLPSKNLPQKIGLYHIALVVNAVYDQMKTHPAFTTVFDASASDDDQTARLTYFWWMVLGGHRLSRLAWEVIRSDPRMVISPSQLGIWLALFRETALPIIGADLTGAWMRRVAQLSRKLPLTGGSHAVQLLHISYTASAAIQDA
jgi:truncated hemoglobin YjbI